MKGVKRREERRGERERLKGIKSERVKVSD